MTQITGIRAGGRADARNILFALGAVEGRLKEAEKPMKEAQAIATLHRIGEDIIALADYLAAYYSNDKPAAEAVEQEQPKAVPEEKSVIKLEDVRTVLAEISRSGKTTEMKALLGKFGASRLSDVKPEDYADLLEAAKEVKNA